MTIIKDYKVRQWLYGIATAVLVLLGGYGLFTAQEQDSILQLILAVLNLGGAGATFIAERNTNPPEVNGKHVAE